MAIVYIGLPNTLQPRFHRYFETEKMKIPLIVFFLFTVIVMLMTGYWPYLSQNVLPSTTWGLYSRGFFEGLLGGAHSSIIDLFLVAIVLYWFERRATAREKREREKSERAIAIDRHRESLADLRYDRGQDSSRRTLTAMKRLMNLGVHDFPCPEAKLDEMRVENFDFEDSNMRAISLVNSKISNSNFVDCQCDAANLTGARLKQVEFSRVSFARAKFCGAQLSGIDFSSCKLERADFSGANLRSAIFRDVDCKGVSFKDADLRSANFLGARNLTPEMLAAAKNSDYIQLPPHTETLITRRESNTSWPLRKQWLVKTPEL